MQFWTAVQQVGQTVSAKSSEERGVCEQHRNPGWLEYAIQTDWVQHGERD